MDKDQTVGYLIQKLIDNNVINAKSLASGRQTIKNWMKNGRLVLRERPHSKWRVVTHAEVQEIIQAFRPGGAGEWHYKVESSVA